MCCMFMVQYIELYHIEVISRSFRPALRGLQPTPTHAMNSYYDYSCQFGTGFS